MTIKIVLWKRLSIRKIVKVLNKSPSAISGEIKRGITLKGTYFAVSTERLIRQRKLNDKRTRKINDIKLQEYALHKLKDKKFPDIIAHDIGKVIE